MPQSGESLKDHRGITSMLIYDVTPSRRQRSMQKMYESLYSEFTHLQSGLKHQAGLIQKLRPLLNETKQGE